MPAQSISELLPVLCRNSSVPGLGVTAGPAMLLSLLVYRWFWSQDLKHCWAALGDAIYRPERSQSSGSRPKRAVHSLWLRLQLPTNADSDPKYSGLRPTLFWFSFLGWGMVFGSSFSSVHPSLSSSRALGFLTELMGKTELWGRQKKKKAKNHNTAKKPHK